jgi:predicted lysophospholipase L1 biosynthesis ABC-type transport system permease subunit
MRSAGLAAVAAGVQGMFLYRAIFDVRTFASWMLWLAVLVVLIVGFMHAGIRDSRLNKAEAAERDELLERQAASGRRRRDVEQARRRHGRASE